MRKILYFLIIFNFGYVIHDVVYDIIKPAKAEVAGMSKWDLYRDWDFKGAVEYILNDKISDLESEISYLKSRVSDLENRISYLE
nr:MAG TPA: Coronin-1A [Bacteriophage sp.]